MRRFAERTDRGQWALFPECLMTRPEIDRSTLKLRSRGTDRQVNMSCPLWNLRAYNCGEPGDGEPNVLRWAATCGCCRAPKSSVDLAS